MTRSATAARWLSLEWLRFWGRSTREGQRGIGRRWRRFGRPVSRSWEKLRGSWGSGTEEYGKGAGIDWAKGRPEKVRWTESEGAKEAQDRVRRLVAKERDRRLQIWARVRLGGERGRDVAKEFGYRDGSGVTQVVKRLEAAATQDGGSAATNGGVERGCVKCQGLTPIFFFVIATSDTCRFHRGTL